MKRVVSSSMVAHLWANKSQSDARNATGSMFFDEGTIYSYGKHFPIAQHHTALDGSAVILFTNRTYSVTTAKHISEVRHALHHHTETLISCTDVSGIQHADNLQGMREECLVALGKASRARSHSAWYQHQAEALAAEHLAYRTAFGMALDAPLTIAEDWKKEARGRTEAQKALEVERKKQQAVIAQRRMVEKLEDLERWKTGEIIVRSGFSDCPVALRVRYAEHITGQSLPDTIQTSLGAEVPATHAKRLWLKIQNIRATGQGYTRNGHTEHVGAFAVDSIEANGTLHAGCHVIEFPAMAELAGKLGW